MFRDQGECDSVRKKPIERIQSVVFHDPKSEVDRQKDADYHTSAIDPVTVVDEVSVRVHHEFDVLGRIAGHKWQ